MRNICFCNIHSQKVQINISKNYHTIFPFTGLLSHSPLRDFQSFLAIGSIDCTRPVSFASFLSRKDLLRCRLRGKTFNFAHTTQRTVSFLFAFFFSYIYFLICFLSLTSLHSADMYTLLRWSMTLCTSTVSYSSLLTTLNWIDAYLSPEWIKFPAS